MTIGGIKLVGELIHDNNVSSVLQSALALAPLEYCLRIA